MVGRQEMCGVDVGNVDRVFADGFEPLTLPVVPVNGTDRGLLIGCTGDTPILLDTARSLDERLEERFGKDYTVFRADGCATEYNAQTGKFRFPSNPFVVSYALIPRDAEAIDRYALSQRTRTRKFLEFVVRK